MAAAAGYGDAAPGVGGPAEASAAAATACGALLCDTDLVDATISRLVCEPSMAYGARVAGAELLASCARACALAAASRPAAALARFGGADVVAADLASRAVEPLLTFVCAARLGAAHVTTGTTTTTNAKPVKSVSSYSVDYEGVTPMGGGALVDAGCAALEAIAAAAPADVVARWAERGASFGSRASRATASPPGRARAWRLLALAASPARARHARHAAESLAGVAGRRGEDRAGPYGGSRGARRRLRFWPRACRRRRRRIKTWRLSFSRRLFGRGRERRTRERRTARSPSPRWTSCLC